MKNILLTLTICFVLSLSANAQDVCPTGKVCIDQQTANRLFNVAEQLIEAKDTIEKLLKERGASDAAINSALKTIEGWKQLDEINNTIILKQKDVIALYEKVIGMYQRVVEDLEKRLMKPKSAFSKVLGFLKDLGLVLAGVSLGRGL